MYRNGLSIFVYFGRCFHSLITHLQRQVLINILSNALKFTHGQNARVTVRCSVDMSQTIEHQQDEVVLKFEVIDSGEFVFSTGQVRR